MTALTWSISTPFWTGWLCYVAALAAFVRAARRASARAVPSAARVRV